MVSQDFSLEIIKLQVTTNHPQQRIREEIAATPLQMFINLKSIFEDCLQGNVPHIDTAIFNKLFFRIITLI